MTVVLVSFVLVFFNLLGLAVPYSKDLVAHYEGDVMLGALFPVHHRGTNNSCGELQIDDGIQPLEALFFTLDRINQDPDLLPNITLGVIALDSCDNIVYALDQSLDFIKGFMAQWNRDEERFVSCAGNGAPNFMGKLTNKPVVGIIGDQSSDVSIQVATLLRIFRIPQISYLSTSPTLSDRNRFPYFFRTVPNDVTQAQAILEILKHFNWTYASLVYGNSEYGIKGYETLTKNAADYRVCFAAKIKIDETQMKPSDYDTIVQELLSRPLALVVVLFTDKTAAREILAAAKRTNNQRKFIWVGCDGWSGRYSVVSGLESAVEGAITVQPVIHQIEGFQEYFKNLRPETNLRNPWFSEYWQKYFKCNLVGRDSGLLKNRYSQPCKSGMQLKAKTELKYLHFVRDSVYAFAHALHNLQKEICGNISGICDAMKSISGEQLKLHLENVSFQDESNRTFRFYEGFDGPPRYSILNFQKREDDSYEWRDVGTYLTGPDGKPELQVRPKQIQFRRYSPKYPNSTCNVPCDPKKGLVPYQQSNDTCCPQCKSCDVFDRVNSGQCDPCPLGEQPTTNRTACKLLPEQIIDYRDPWAIGSMAFATLGILLSCGVGAIFWKNRDTPIIKASGRELSALLLIGTLFSFAMTFLITSKPTTANCGIIRFSLGLTYTVCFAAIAVKTNRIARIFGQKTGTLSAPSPRAKYISPQSQLAITGMLIFVEVVINTCWLFYHPPYTKHIFPTRTSRILICDGMDNYSYLVGLVYPFLLVGCCTVYAFQTRKCPGGFNEARYIGFTSYTTSILWLAFVPLFLAATSSAIRVITLAISLSVGGMVQLACLFAPKVYIVLFKPEKNTREGVMANHRPSSYALATPPVAASLSLVPRNSLAANGRQGLVVNQN